MVPHVVGQLLFQLDHVPVEGGIRLARIAQQMGVDDALLGLEAAVGQDIDIDIDALCLEAGDQVVQVIHRLGVEFGGHVAARTLGIAEDVGRVPLGVELMETHDVAADLRQTQRDVLRVLMVGEAGAAVEVGSPETAGRAVLKGEMIARRTQQTMLACRAFGSIDLSQVDRRIVVIRRVRNVCHKISSCSCPDMRIS